MADSGINKFPMSYISLNSVQSDSECQMKVNGLAGPYWAGTMQKYSLHVYN